MHKLLFSIIGGLLLATAPLAAMPQEAAPWKAADLVGIWDMTLGEGEEVFDFEMILSLDDEQLFGSMNLGGDIDVENLEWDSAAAKLSFTVSFGPDSMEFSFIRDGDSLRGRLSDGGDLDEPVSGILNVAKTEAEAAKAAARARGEVVVGTEVGDRAPEIEGMDLDGVEFKLSEYAGRIVMLDFWGDW
jgi:hypothetical protein